EEKRKADEKVATKEKAEEEAAIKKAAKQKTKVAKEKENEKRTKKGIKTAKAKAKKKEAEEADKGQNIMMRMPKMTSKKMMMKMLMLLLNLKQELLAELEAIKKAAEKEAKASTETGDNDVNVNEIAGAKQTDNEEDAEESDDVEQALNKIPTMPFLNTSTISKQKEVDKDMEQLPKRFTRGDAKKQVDFEDLNEEREIEDDEDVMSTLSENEMEVIRVEEKRRKETTKARRKLIHQKQKR
ncbi:hypothetical protein Tco_1555339, partial [Tanacetum coccineum]